MRLKILLLLLAVAIVCAIIWRPSREQVSDLVAQVNARRSSLPSPPPELASKLELVPFVTGLSMPVGMAVPVGEKNGRLFFVEKTGTIRIVRNGQVEPTPYLDLTKEVSTGGEQGLLGLAFHPDYQTTGRVFVNYTDKKGDTQVVEFKVSTENPDVADVSKRFPLLTIKQPYANHNGGNLAFGPDRKLYIGTGDGGSGNDPEGNGQNDATLLGKMIRIDVDSGTPRPEISAKGLRNPWRYSFDRVAQDLYIADVGQNRYEWVHVVPKGQIRNKNFGWNILEGNHCLQGESCDRTGLETPEIEYPHPQGCAITGGYVYRGHAIPELNGHYFYGDFCADWIRSFRWSDGKVVDEYDWSSVLNQPSRKVGQVTAFGEDNDGELYLISADGKVQRFARKS